MFHGIHVSKEVRMKKGSVALAIALCLAASLSAQIRGPIVDRIAIDAKTKQDIALADVASGQSDLFDYGIDGAAFKALPDGVKAKLETYAVNGASYVDLFINPYPNKAPYTATGSDGTVLFNPFAIRAVRYAMNFLIDRKKIIDEIMSGAGRPMYTPVSQGQPNSARFAIIAAKLGFTSSGDEGKALADIDAAMRRAAAADPKLAKNDQWWTYNGRIVTVRFLIRVDEPNLRLPMGRYIADEIEKAGIKVERLEYDRTTCSSILNKTDPADCQWNLYTEAWGGGQTYEFWDGSVAQMYAPWGSYMPGEGRAGQWNYQNPQLDQLTQDCVNYRISSDEEYYDKLLAATELGIKDAVRVFIASQTTYTCANKDNFTSRMLYGVGDGIDAYSLYSADVKRGPDGLKTLKLSLYSSQGALINAAWDPIGPDGFDDTASRAIIKNVSDPEYGADPLTGAPFPMTAVWSKVKTGAIDFGVSPPAGSIPVPPSAVLWNARDRRWERGINYVDVKGDGAIYDYVQVPPEKNKAWSEATFTFKFGRWQDGRRIDMNDYRYAIARPYDLCVQRSEDDKVYEASYAAAVNPMIVRVKGMVFNGGDSITVYGDANNPMDQNALAAQLCPSLMIGGSNNGAIIPWPIHEALRSMVAEGAASATHWVFNDNGDFSEVDLLAPNCVADIKAKLEELAANKAVPASLAGYVTPSQAVAAYEKAIAFIDKHGHAVISNGGFVIDSYDARNNTMLLAANRDPAYPFEQFWFSKKLSSDFIRIDSVGLGTYRKGEGLRVTADLSQVGFPSGIAKPAAKARISVTLVSDTDKTVAGALTGAGIGEATIPASYLDNLQPGDYTILVEASLGVEAGDVKAESLVVF
jgi:peptide/nickel transport system substrate-binding protein